LRNGLLTVILIPHIVLALPSNIPVIPLPRAYFGLLSEDIPTMPKPGAERSGLLLNELPAQPKSGAERSGLLLDEATIPKPGAQSGLLAEEWPAQPKPGPHFDLLAEEIPSQPKPRALIADDGGGTASDPTG
jgi:hypothetical protein